MTWTCTFNVSFRQACLKDTANRVSGEMLFQSVHDVFLQQATQAALKHRTAVPRGFRRATEGSLRSKSIAVAASIPTRPAMSVRQLVVRGLELTSQCGGSVAKSRTVDNDEIRIKKNANRRTQIKDANKCLSR